MTGSDALCRMAVARRARCQSVRRGRPEPIPLATVAVEFTLRFWKTAEGAYEVHVVMTALTCLYSRTVVPRVSLAQRKSSQSNDLAGRRFDPDRRRSRAWALAKKRGPIAGAPKVFGGEVIPAVGSPKWGVPKAWLLA